MFFLATVPSEFPPTCAICILLLADIREDVEKRDTKWYMMQNEYFLH